MEEVKKEMFGTVVLTRYNNRFYKITDILSGRDDNPISFNFGFKERKINLIEYYTEKWNLRIKDK